MKLIFHSKYPSGSVGDQGGGEGHLRAAAGRRQGSGQDHSRRGMSTYYVKLHMQDILDTLTPMGIWKSVTVSNNRMLTVTLHPIIFMMRKVNWQ